VWVDLVLKVAGQKAETFAGFDRGPRQDDAADLLLEKGIDRHGDRQEALAGSGDSDPENEIVLCDRVEVFALIGGLWGDGLFAGRVETGLLEMILEAVSPILCDLLECVL